MGSIYRRGNKLWWRVKDEHGKWTSIPSGFSVGQEKAAELALRKLEAGSPVGSPAAAPTAPRMTLRGWFDEWQLRQAHKASYRQITTHFETWILPALGTRDLAGLEPEDLAAVSEKMRQANLSPLYIGRVQASLHLCLVDAVSAKRETGLLVVPSLSKRQRMIGGKPLPRLNRATAIYTQAELEQLLTDERLHLCDRNYWGLEGCAGMRGDDVNHLRWRDWEPTAQPLGRIVVSQTKTGVARSVPVHPTLAAALSAWKLSGWSGVYGRPPRPDDLICPWVPSRTHRPEVACLRERTTGHSLEHLHAAQDLLGWPRRRGHDLRRTFISLCREHGSDMHGTALRETTHGRESGVFGSYSETTWAAQCKAVLCLPVKLRKSAQVVALRKVANGDGTEEFATVFATVDADPHSEPSCGQPVCPSHLPKGSNAGGQQRAEGRTHRGVAPVSSDGGVDAEARCGTSDCSKCSKAGTELLAWAVTTALEHLEAGEVEEAARVLRKAQP